MSRHTIKVTDTKVSIIADQVVVYGPGSENLPGKRINHPTKGWGTETDPGSVVWELKYNKYGKFIEDLSPKTIALQQAREKQQELENTDNTNTPCQTGSSETAPTAQK
jgi:YD repeat-containing protein